MTMARVNVIIPDRLLETLDQSAEDEKMSRSGLIQEAVRRYLHERRLEQESLARRKKMERAASKMDRLANKLGKWNGVGIIRQFRDQRTEET
jgi:metal-responsive CopG/Arc/MetJ family transcriptional regulator